MPQPERKTVSLQEWQELCRQQDEARARAAAEKHARRQLEDLPPTVQQLSPAEQQTYRRWGSIATFTLVYTLTIGWASTLIFGLVWTPGLPSALASYAYRPVPAHITLFAPRPCGKVAGGPPVWGIHYTYTFEGREYSSSRVLPPPFSNDHLDNCGKPLWQELQAGERDPQTGKLMTTAYVNPIMPTLAVLRRGVPVSLVGLWGLFSLICVLFFLWSWQVGRVLEARGKAPEARD